jgi:hypothetical protein
MTEASSQEELLPFLFITLSAVNVHHHQQIEAELCFSCLLVGFLVFEDHVYDYHLPFLVVANCFSTQLQYLHTFFVIPVMQNPLFSNSTHSYTIVITLEKEHFCSTACKVMLTWKKPKSIRSIYIISQQYKLNQKLILNMIQVNNMRHGITHRTVKVLLND